MLLQTGIYILKHDICYYISLKKVVSFHVLLSSSMIQFNFIGYFPSVVYLGQIYYWWQSMSVSGGAVDWIMTEGMKW